MTNEKHSDDLTVSSKMNAVTPQPKNLNSKAALSSTGKTIESHLGKHFNEAIYSLSPRNILMNQ